MVFNPGWALRMPLILAAIAACKEVFDQHGCECMLEAFANEALQGQPAHKPCDSSAAVQIPTLHTNHAGYSRTIAGHGVLRAAAFVRLRQSQKCSC